MSKYDVEWINNRENSAVSETYLSQRGIPETEALHAKVIKMARLPSLEPEQHGTLGWTRMYSLTAHCREDYLLDAWELMQFLGGKDATGDYYTARRWFQLRGLGFAFISLMDDPEIIALTEKWGTSNWLRNYRKSPESGKTSKHHGFLTSTFTISRRSRRSCCVNSLLAMDWDAWQNGVRNLSRSGPSTLATLSWRISSFTGPINSDEVVNLCVTKNKQGREKWQE